MARLRGSSSQNTVIHTDTLATTSITNLKDMSYLAMLYKWFNNVFLLQYYEGDKRPLWFVFSGMGSQWAGMGLTLMKIPVFAAAVHKCHQLLKPKGVDLIRIITDTDPTTFDNILNSFVGIAAIQVT